MDAPAPPTPPSPFAARPSPATAPGRLRRCAYLAFALIAVLCTGRLWLAQEHESARRDEAEALAIAATQLAEVPGLARHAALAVGAAVGGGVDAIDPQGALAALLQPAGDAAARADELLQRHDGAPAALPAWRTARERQQQLGLSLQQRLQAGDDAGAAAAALQLQLATPAAEAAGRALLHELQEAMQQRSRAAQHRVEMTSIAVLLLLLALALVVVEPGARSLARDAERLAGQSADLQRLALVAERTHSSVLLTDAERRIVWTNSAFTRLTGYAPDEAIGRLPGDLLQSNSIDVEATARMRAALDRGEGLRVELRGRSKSGHDLWIDADIQPLRDAAGAISGYVAVQTDTTAQVTQRLRNAALLAALPTGVVVQSADGSVVDGNRAAEDMLGLSREQLLGSDPLDPGWQALYEDGSSCPIIDRPAMRTLRSGRGLRGEAMGVRCADGEPRWLLVNTEPLHDALGRPDGVVSCYTDVTDGRRLQDQLSRGARTDALTELPNRTVVHERVQRAIEHARRHPGYGYAVLFMDLDRFKQINDTLGHGVGDDLLRQVAHRLTQTLRPGDTVGRLETQRPTAARIGGDEFVVVLEGIRHADDVHVVAQRLLEALTQPYAVGPHHVQSSASIGVVLSAHAGDSADAVLRDADTAMYEAKRAGRGRYVVFDPSMHERVVHALAVENDLRRALRERQLYVVYQPVIELESGRACGVEALVRWRHPQRGLVSPVEFIPVAEECGLIGALGDYVLEAACRQFADWGLRLGAARPGLLAVNVSRAQLMTPGLAASVQAVLLRTGMAAAQLQLEVTESLAAQDHTVQATLDELKALGVQLALDDFGTGYSSLACLHQMPVDTVKIDRSFLGQVETSGYHRVVIEATIRVARTLGMTCVAEGIETPAQAALMRTLQCQRGQGYLYSKPLAADELEGWLQAHGAGHPDAVAAALADREPAVPA